MVSAPIKPSTFASQEENLVHHARRAISRLVILRRKYLNLIKELAPKTNKRLAGCAAMLIDYIRHWQEWKLENHRTPWLYQPLKFICEDLMTYSMHTVRAGIALLEKLGLLQKRCNPGNYQDKTYQYNILFDRVQDLIDRLGITNEVGAETPVQSPFVSPESSNFSPESSNFSPESSNFTVEQYQQLLSTNSSTPVLASLSEESEKEVENPQEEDVSNLITKVPSYSQKPDTNYVDKIKVQKSQEQKVTGESQCSAVRDVNQDKTPRKVEHTKPDYYLNGFESQEEKDGFYQALLELGKQKAGVRSPVGWACNIIKDINAGGLCQYLSEYRQGEPLGMFEKQEWEYAPDQVYPRFLTFLRGRLKTNQMSGEQAIAAAHRALRDTAQAKEHWESFKRTVVNFADQWKRDKALGLTGAYIPPELMLEAEITIQEAGRAMHLLEISSIQEKALAPAAQPDVIAPASESEIENEIVAESDSEIPSAEKVAQWHKLWNSKVAKALRPLITSWVEQTNGAVIITDDGPVLKSELVTDEDSSDDPWQDDSSDDADDTEDPAVNLACRLYRCDSWSEVQALLNGVSQAMIDSTWTYLTDEEKEYLGRLEADAKAQEQAEVIAQAEVSQAVGFQVGDPVFVENCPHTDEFGPFLIEDIEGDWAKVEMFEKLVRLCNLRSVEPTL